MGHALEWQVNTRRWRWWMLTSLGCCGPLACGGRSTDGEGGPELTTPRASPGGTAQSPPAPRPVSATTGQLTPSVNPVPPTPIAARWFACEQPTAISGGWESCANGMRHRTTRGECSSSLPRARLVPDAELLLGVELSEEGLLPDGGSVPLGVLACVRDADCTERLHGHCERGQGGPDCRYGCLTDAECAPGEACLCGDPVGVCVPAACATDSDCAPGRLCTDYPRQPYCGGPALACQTPEDECAVDADCPGGAPCTIVEGDRRRTCSNGVCDIGRPFLVAGTARLAPAIARADWQASGELGACRAATPERGDADLHTALAAAWTEQALMEHASIAAFARFILQLMSLGAPADLVERATRAMADETRHAQACFSMAARYADRDVGPGPLSIDGALDGSDLRSIVLTTVHEGCIGETVAAIEAAEVLAHCAEPVARTVLTQIAREEAEHAELAWRFVAWALERSPRALALEVRDAFEQCGSPHVGDDPVSLSERDAALLKHGIAGSGLRSALRRRVLGDVVRPCADELLSRYTQAPAGLVPAARYGLNATSS